MPVRSLICILALAAGLASTAASGARPVASKRTFTLSPRPQYVNLAVRIAGRNWPRCGTVRVTGKPRGSKAITIAKKLPIRANGSFRRSWYPTWRMAGLWRLTVTASCGSRRVIRSSSLIRILATP